MMALLEAARDALVGAIHMGIAIAIVAALVGCGWCGACRRSASIRTRRWSR
jgi:hypothetical protein